uniref:Protein preY, mitochondrial n=2 Tax=Canis lupus familiaris TaxID=9615 RepID=A0A8C0T806_CANLF
RGRPSEWGSPVASFSTHAVSFCAFMCPGRGGQQASQRTGDPAHAFHGVPLEFLVCPLSEKPLRYEASTNELINEESGIAHLIIDGIPNVVPPAARMTHQKQKQEHH